MVQHIREDISIGTKRHAEWEFVLLFKFIIWCSLGDRICIVVYLFVKAEAHPLLPTPTIGVTGNAELGILAPLTP
jgi:hypothetical protein